MAARFSKIWKKKVRKFHIDSINSNYHYKLHISIIIAHLMQRFKVYYLNSQNWISTTVSPRYVTLKYILILAALKAQPYYQLTKR